MEVPKYSEIAGYSIISGGVGVLGAYALNGLVTVTAGPVTLLPNAIFVACTLIPGIAMTTWSFLFSKQEEISRNDINWGNVGIITSYPTSIMITRIFFSSISFVDPLLALGVGSIIVSIVYHILPQ